MLVPDDPKLERGKWQPNQSDSDGSFNFFHVAPGAYTVAAIEDGWTLDWSRPEVMAPYLERGVKVIVAGGSRAVNPKDAVEAQPRKLPANKTSAGARREFQRSRANADALAHFLRTPSLEKHVAAGGRFDEQGEIHLKGGPGRLQDAPDASPEAPAWIGTPLLFTFEDRDSERRAVAVDRGVLKDRAVIFVAEAERGTVPPVEVAFAVRSHLDGGWQPRSSACSMAWFRP